MAVNDILFVLGRAASLFLIVFGVTILVVCTYRLNLHPLAKFPGPRLAKLTNLYSAYHAWKGDLHLDVWRCHEKYGDYVRYAPNGLLVNNVAGLRDVYGHGRNFKKSKKYSAMMHRAPNTLTTIDKKAHGRKRRVISQGFSDSAMRSYEDIVLSHVRKFCAQLYRVNGEKRIANPGWSVAIDMAKWCDFLTFDIMSDVVFGVAYNTLENNRYRFVPEAIEASNVRVGVIAQAPEMKLWRLDKRLFPQAIKARNRFISFVDEMLRDGIKATSTKKGRIMSLLMDAKDPETDTIIRKSELGAETATLIVAGTDTTSTAIASMFFYLTHNPKAYTRLAQEIRSTFGSNEDIHLGQRLNSCTYLRACIDESMRMSPSVGGALWREADAGGAIVDGQVIAAGCDVGTGIYSIHHNPEYYPCPFDFVPERWLSEEASSIHGEVDLAHAALNPFSFGPRGCIGKGLAYMEMVLTWAHVLWSFEFKAADGPEGQIGEGQPGAEHGRHRTGEYQLEDRLTSAKHGPYIQFYPRAVQ